MKLEFLSRINEKCVSVNTVCLVSLSFDILLQYIFIIKHTQNQTTTTLQPSYIHIVFLFLTMAKNVGRYNIDQCMHQKKNDSTCDISSEEIYVPATYTYTAQKEEEVFDI